MTNKLSGPFRIVHGKAIIDMAEIVALIHSKTHLTFACHFIFRHFLLFATEKYYCCCYMQQFANYKRFEHLRKLGAASLK